MSRGGVTYTDEAAGHTRMATEGPRMKRLRGVIFLAVMAALGAGGAPEALAAAAPAAGDAAPPRAEIFATSNTAIITDPRDPRLSDRLTGFEHQVDDIIDDGGADAGRATLVAGVFWS